MAEFSFLNKSDFPALAPRLFTILADNMDSIDPPELSREAAFSQWQAAVGDGLGADARQIILIRETASGRLLGFLQYYTNAEILMIEEIQILPACQGRVNFLRGLYCFVLSQIPGNLRYVEAFVHKTNIRSLRLQKKLGMRIVGTAQNDKLYHLRGSFPDFTNWYISRKTTPLP